MKKSNKINQWLCLMVVFAVAVGINDTECFAKVKYNAERAANYAQTYAKKRNPKYVSYASNCTNFVSQALEAGGYKQNNAWFCGMVASSQKWSVSKQNYNYVRKQKWGYLVKKYSMSGNLTRPGCFAPGVSKGGVIYYDWNADGKIDHASFVTFSGQNKSTGKYETLICQNTADRKNDNWNLQKYLKEFDKKNCTNRAKKCVYYVVDVG